MSKIVYLYGPITGLTYDGAQDWRTWMREQLAPHGIEAVSPLRFKDYLAKLGEISGHGRDYVFLLSKVQRLADEAKAVLGGYYREFLIAERRNRRSVWTVPTKPYKGAHFATYPEELIEPCILAGAPAGGVVLDPFFGSGTTGQVAQNLGRQWIGCELNPAYKSLQDERLRQPGLILESA